MLFLLINHVLINHPTRYVKVSEQVSPNQWLILVLVMATNPKMVIRDCRLFGGRLTSDNDQSKI